MPKTVVKEFLVYSFEELSEEAKHKAIDEWIAFVIEVTEYEQGSDNFKKACDMAACMLTPWFLREYVWKYCQEEILEDLATCYFYRDGKFYERAKFFHRSSML